MITVVSPSKTMNFDDTLTHEHLSQPQFLEEANKVAAAMEKLSKKKLQKLLDINDSLAELNFSRYKEFVKRPGYDHGRPAIYAYRGDVYNELEIQHYNDRDLEFANKHVRILSGLYGILRPLDNIQPYRLEMGTKLKVGRKNNLYDYWGDKMAKTIAKELERHDEELVINLASNEYFKAINVKNSGLSILNIHFKEKVGNEYRVKGFNAKRARGIMLNFIIKNKVDISEGLKDFAMADYSFNKSLSDDNNFVFTRG